MVGGTKRNKSHYAHSAKKARMSKFALVEGLKGFLLTCNHRKKEAIREGYNVLNKYADARYGKEGQEEVDLQKEEIEMDIDKAMELEREQLAKLADKKGAARRFQVVESGVQNLLFVKTSLDSPKEVVGDLLRDLEETREQQTRYLLRLVPVEITCKAFTENVEAAARKVLPEHFSGKGADVSYQILFKSRLNNSFPKEEAYRALGGVIRELNSVARVDFKDSKVVIVCEVMKNIVCLSVLNDYFRYKKYNLMEVVGNHQVDQVKNKEENKEDARVEDGEKPAKEDQSEIAQDGNGAGDGEEEKPAKGEENPEQGQGEKVKEEEKPAEEATPKEAEEETGT